jgi:hypothetical protein
MGQLSANDAGVPDCLPVQTLYEDVSNAQKLKKYLWAFHFWGVSVSAFLRDLEVRHPPAPAT